MKIIEVVPGPALAPIIQVLQDLGGVEVARHRYGCRVLERLLEFGTEGQMARLFDQCIINAEDLSRHQFGNFVIQSLLEHGTEQQRREILSKLLPTVPSMASHRVASHVVQRALNHSDEDGQRDIATALLQAMQPNSFADIAASRYGSYVAEELLSVFGAEGWPGKDAKRLLEAALPKYLDNQNFTRVALTYGLLRKEDVPVSGSHAVAE